MHSDLFQLSGKKALITGASRGLGLAIAKGLAQHGADVALMARNSDELTNAANQITTETNRTVSTFPFDLQHTEAIDAQFTDVVARLSSVDILVNCAGVNLRSPAEQAPLDLWDKVLRLNLTAAFALSAAFCRHRRQLDRPGKIINIGSLACTAARPTTTPYSASKGGLLMLTKGLAVEWAPYNINVNAIGPGYFLTEMTKPLFDDRQFTDWVLSRTPLKRLGQPEDLVGAALLLASSAGDFITGQIIYIDGGWLAAL